MDSETTTLLVNAVPLLVLGALYLGVAAVLAPALRRERPGLASADLAVWLLILAIGIVAVSLGAAKIGDSDPLAFESHWPVLALALVAALPLVGIVGRWRDRHLLVTAGSRLAAAEEAATERGRAAESISRLSSALSRSLSASQSAEHLFDELESLSGIDAVLLAVVDEEERLARGFAARGVDERWWQGVTIDLDRDAGGIAAVAREGAPYFVYDVASAAHVSRALETLPAKSAAFVPLASENRMTGVLVVVSLSEHRFFAPADLELLQQLANETALALGRTRSAEALEAALEREQLIAGIARKVRSELDLDKVLEVAVRETGAALGLSRCFIRLGEPGSPLPIRAEWDDEGITPVGSVAHRLPVSNLAARERRTVAVDDVIRAPELDDPTLGGRETLLDLGTHAVLATPILVFEEIIGVFGLHRPAATPWTPGEISVAEAVAGEVGLAIHTARLLREDARRLGRQAALLKAAQVVTSDLRFNSVLRRLVDEVASLLGADAADCWIFEPGEELLACRAVKGLPRTELGRRIRPEGTIGAAITTVRPVLTRNFSETEDPPPSASYVDFEEVLAAPITWLGEVRGVLGVCSRKTDHFDGADLELLDAYARFASLAFHNAESFEERERQAQIQQGFYRIAEVLGSPLSLSETLNALAQAAAEALGGIAAFVLEPSGDRLVLAGAYDVLPRVAAEIEAGIAEHETPLAAAAREERIVTSGSLRDDDRFAGRWRALLDQAACRALISTSVAGASGSRLAVVVLFAEERTFSDNDLALARHLSRAAQGALERGELFETERRARSLSQRLATIGARLVTNLDPSVLLEDVVGEAPGLVEADAATIRLLDGENLVVRAASGLGGETVHGLVGTNAPIGAGLVGDVAQSRTPATVEDAEASPDVGRGDPLLGGAMRACVVVPMIAHGGGLAGVLTVYAAAARAWREEEVQALVALAAVASAGLSNAELYQRVAEEKERSNAILLNIADGIVAVDRDERIVLWNQMAEQITGVPAPEALGRRVQEVLQRELAGEGRKPGREEPVTITRGGKEVFLFLTEAVMTDPSGNVAGRIFAFRDISSERLVDQMKSDFVATVSHELRTPLTSIYGFAETLLRSDVAFEESDRATFLGYIASESERLIRIVDDLLNVARLEAGTLRLALEPTDVGEVVDAVTASVEEHVNGAHSFAVELPEGGLYADADREKLTQILLQLVDNAVKFSPEGGTITIAGRRKTDAVELRVADEGVGIPRSDQHRIFTKFYRAETAPLTGAHGTGLGLFLVRGLLAAMGGRIAVESDEGEGATFIFELPVSRSAPEGKRSEVEATGRS